MPVVSPGERKFLSAVAQLGYSNPFLPERVEFERAALGRDFSASEPVWSASVADPEAVRPNIGKIHQRLEPLIENVAGNLATGGAATDEELFMYEACVHHLLYQRYYASFLAAQAKAPFYRRFVADWQRYLQIPGKHFETSSQPAHLFACFRQIQRAFHHIFDNIIGNSMPAARLRASVWQSIFTHDMRRYRRTLHDRMGDFPTLITGPSGTGKELVARAIAGSRYVPFNPDRMEFADVSGESFFPINLAALSPTLIESELFGHLRGAFTGAIGDRKGWLEACPPQGSVFLDELGEMDLSIQVKLLRVIETRRFSAVGETALRHFRGKLIAATNRKLPVEIRSGRFREDLYYRLCADLVTTPSLREQLDDTPGVLDDLLHYMVRRVVGEEINESLREVKQWMSTHLPKEYTWPGNYRELEQCVRNVIIRRSYQPIQERGGLAEDKFTHQLRQGNFTAEHVLAWYAALVYRQTGSYEETARKLNLDRRTVKAKVETYLSNVAQT
jgi:transcriptional regulator with AAA-type ATPase domain